MVGGCSKCLYLSVQLFSGHWRASQAYLDQCFENFRSIDLVIVFTSIFCVSSLSLMCIPFVLSSAMCLWCNWCGCVAGLSPSSWWLVPLMISHIKGQVEGKPSSLGCLAPHQQPTSSGSTLTHTSGPHRAV